MADLLRFRRRMEGLRDEARTRDALRVDARDVLPELPGLLLDMRDIPKGSSTVPSPHMRLLRLAIGLFRGSLAELELSSSARAEVFWGSAMLSSQAVISGHGTCYM